MPDMKPNPDATEVIWNVAICFTEMKTEFTVYRFKYYEWGGSGEWSDTRKRIMKFITPAEQIL